jgi:hypothetical protein
MNRRRCVLLLPLATALAIGCDPATPASSSQPAEAVAEQPEVQPVAKLKTTVKKKKEPGVGSSLKISTRPRKDL